MEEKNMAAMTELDALIKLLTVQLGDNTRLRDALVETLFVFMEEEHQRETGREQLSYLELLEQIEEQRLQLDKAKQYKLSASLKALGEQIRDELRQAAFSLHQAVRSKQFEPDERLVQRVGVVLDNFPIGFPKDFDLLKLSEAYIKDTRDLHFLQQHDPDTFPELIHKITSHKKRVARWLQYVVAEALSTEVFPEHHLLHFRKEYLKFVQRLKTAAENELSVILKLTNNHALSDVEEWFYSFGSLANQVIKQLSPRYKKTLFGILIYTRDCTILEALPLLEPEDNEKSHFEILMTLRFGQAFQDAGTTWKTWFERNLEQRTRREQALTFWKEQYPYSIPEFLFEFSAEHHPMVLHQKGALEVSESLNVRMFEEMGEVELEEFLERRSSIMTNEEIQMLEEEIQKLTVPPSKPEFRLEETITVLETAVDAAIEGDLLEATIITAIDKGSEIAEEYLTVTIEEAAQEKPGVEPVPSVTEEEPTENIWTNHIFPFVRQNLVFVLAPGLIFIGLLLLVFTLWDKAAWIRYGLTPFMLVSMSYTLSRIGLWLKGQDIQSETPIVTLQIVSIFLAPMSLLFVALLFADGGLSLLIKILSGIFLSAALLAAWGYIFVLSTKSVHSAMASIHSWTLLLLNALLLLVLVAQFTISPKDESLNLSARTLLVGGFYMGFLVLCWSMRRVLGKMMEKDISSSRVSMIFYSITCLGTFVLVWGLTHARLLILPQPHTYGPLLLLFGFLLSMIEFRLLEIRGQTGRITSLSYTAYFFIFLGVVLSITHDYVRVVALLLAGLVFFYQAIKTKDARHFNISMAFLIAGFSSIALIRDFPAPFFPYLTLIVVLGLYIMSLTFPVKEVTLLIVSLSPIYMSFAFVVSILWQWAGDTPPLSYGIAFVFFGIFALYIGAKTDKLIHVHTGAFYTVAALPYLGTVDMNLYTLEGNTLVFGLALVGIFWTMVSSASRTPAIKDSRSTVLWNIGILAFCVMCLRVIFRDTLDFSANPFLQFQILTGPVIIAGLMLLAGYFTQSYLAVYLALVILVIIFPEIKDRFNIPMYSGLGSTMSGIGFLTLALVLGILEALRKDRKADLIWRKKTFPFQAKNFYLLFANPVVVAAFFLFTRTIFVTYPKNYFKPLMPFSIKTLVAVLLCGTAYHFFSVWFKKIWFSYIGFIAICFSIIHSCYIDVESFYFDELYLPIFILIALIYCGGIRLISPKILPAERAKFIGTPFKHLQYFVIWLVTLGFYIFYSLYYAAFYQTTFCWFWLPLLLYLCVVSGGLSWKATHAKHSWISLIPAYLLFWQCVTLITTRGDYLPYVLESSSRFYFSSSLMVLGIVSTFFVFEHTVPKKKFRVLSPVLWISFVLLLIFSPLLTLAFYVMPSEFSYLLPQIIVWAIVSFIVGRFLNLGPLWLWSAYLLHLLFLPSIKGLTTFYLSFHPFTLACIAIFLSVLSMISVKVKRLYEYKYCYPWAKNHFLSPSFLFAVTAHLVVIFIFFQAISLHYRHEWMTIAGLFLAALPALFAAHQLGFSRHFLFGVPYTLAWMGLTLAVKANFPEHGWLIHLNTAQIISLGLFGALFTAVLSDYVLPCKDKTYRHLKAIVATGVIFLVIFTYFTIRNIELISWQWLLTSGILSLGGGLYFRYLEE